MRKAIPEASMQAPQTLVKSLFKKTDAEPALDKERGSPQLDLPGTKKCVPPGVLKGRINEDRIIEKLATYGWLTMQQIRKSCWPTDNKDPLQSARTVVRRLIRKGDVIRRETEGNPHAYILSAAGARRAQAAGIEHAQAGTDLLRGKRNSTWYHRYIANEYLIEKQLVGSEYIVSEFDIQAARTPFPDRTTNTGEKARSRGWMNKVPDGLIVHHPDDGTKGAIYLHWIEIENSRRKASDAEALVTLIVKGLLNNTIVAEQLYLSTVQLVFTYDSKDPKSLCRILRLLRPTCKMVEKTLAEFLAPYDQKTREGHRRSILTRTHITLMDMAPGLILRRMLEDWTLEDAIDKGLLTELKTHCSSLKKNS